MAYEDDDDLDDRIDRIYDKLDIDGQKTLSFDEFRFGKGAWMSIHVYNVCVCKSTRAHAHARTHTRASTWMLRVWCESTCVCG